MQKLTEGRFASSQDWANPTNPSSCRPWISGKPLGTTVTLSPSCPLGSSSKLSISSGERSRKNPRGSVSIYQLRVALTWLLAIPLNIVVSSRNASTGSQAWKGGLRDKTKTAAWETNLSAADENIIFTRKTINYNLISCKKRGKIENSPWRLHHIKLPSCSKYINFWYHLVPNMMDGPSCTMTLSTKSRERESHARCKTHWYDTTTQFLLWRSVSRRNAALRSHVTDYYYNNLAKYKT